jgi:hypothetical protein
VGFVVDKAALEQVFSELISSDILLPNSYFQKGFSNKILHAVLVS